MTISSELLCGRIGGRRGVGGAYCAAAAAAGMDDSVPTGAYQHAVAGGFLAAGGKRFSVRAGAESFTGRQGICWMPWRSPRREKAADAWCMRSSSASGIFSDPCAGMPARQGCRTRRRGCGLAGKARPNLGYKDSQVAETEARGTDLAGVGAHLEKILALELGCPVVLDNGKPLRVRWSCAGNFGCKVKRGARKRRGGLTHWAGAKWPLGSGTSGTREQVDDLLSVVDHNHRRIDGVVGVLP